MPIQRIHFLVQLTYTFGYTFLIFVFLEPSHISEKLQFGHGISQKFSGCTYHAIIRIHGIKFTVQNVIGVDLLFFVVKNKNTELGGGAGNGSGRVEVGVSVNMIKIHFVKFSKKIQNILKHAKNVYWFLKEYLSRKQYTFKTMLPSN